MRKFEDYFDHSCKEIESFTLSCLENAIAKNNVYSDKIKPDMLYSYIETPQNPYKRKSYLDFLREKAEDYIKRRLLLLLTVIHEESDGGKRNLNSILVDGLLSGPDEYNDRATRRAKKEWFFDQYKAMRKTYISQKLRKEDYISHPLLESILLTNHESSADLSDDELRRLVFQRYKSNKQATEEEAIEWLLSPKDGYYEFWKNYNIPGSDTLLESAFTIIWQINQNRVENEVQDEEHLATYFPYLFTLLNNFRTKLSLDERSVSCLKTYEKFGRRHSNLKTSYDSLRKKYTKFINDAAKALHVISASETVPGYAVSVNKILFNGITHYQFFRGLNSSDLFALLERKVDMSRLAEVAVQKTPSSREVSLADSIYVSESLFLVNALQRLMEFDVNLSELDTYDYWREYDSPESMNAKRTFPHQHYHTSVMLALKIMDDFLCEVKSQNGIIINRLLERYSIWFGNQTPAEKEAVLTQLAEKVCADYAEFDFSGSETIQNSIEDTFDYTHSDTEIRMKCYLLNAACNKLFI